ncbi:hypothetical protein AB0L99_39250 [Streptomyces sp. NPDC051954]|uniref:hypothetical protein n=1 Tax=unclassified Streptomyces TaxID=2593676 RepID=UPI003446C537
MRCEQDKSVLAAYAMAALKPEEADGVGRHLRECPDCWAETDDLLATLVTLRRLPEEDLLGDWADRIPELREAAIRAALE